MEEIRSRRKLGATPDDHPHISPSAEVGYEHVRPDTDDRLPFVKLGKYLRFDRRDLKAYIDSKRAESRRQPRRR